MSPESSNLNAAIERDILRQTKLEIACLRNEINSKNEELRIKEDLLIKQDQQIKALNNQLEQETKKLRHIIAEYKERVKRLEEELTPANDEEKIAPADGAIAKILGKAGIHILAVENTQ